MACTSTKALLAEPRAKLFAQTHKMQLDMADSDIEKAETVSNSTACTSSTSPSASFSPVLQPRIFSATLRGCTKQGTAFEPHRCAPVRPDVQIFVVPPEMQFQQMQPALPMVPVLAPMVPVASPTACLGSSDARGLFQRSPAGTASRPSLCSPSARAHATRLAPRRPSTSRGLALGPDRRSRLESDMGPGSTESQRASAVAALRGRALELAHDPQGCRLLQLAFQANARLASELLGELHGHVRELIKSPHGNYVIQKVPEHMPSSCSDFIVRELLGCADYFARHRYGCRVLSRLLEHCDSSSDGAREQLVAELLTRAEVLVTHTYAHHVMEKVLEHGTLVQKDRVLQALLGDPARNAQDRHASFVIQQALVSLEGVVSPDGGDAAFDLASQVLADLEGSDSCVLLLGQDRFGAGLVQSLASVPGLEDTLVDSLEFHMPTLCQTKHGKHLLEKVGLMEAAWLGAARM